MQHGTTWRAWSGPAGCSSLTMRRRRRTLMRMFDGLRSPWQTRLACVYAMPAARPRSAPRTLRHRLCMLAWLKPPRCSTPRKLPPLQNSCTPPQRDRAAAPCRQQPLPCGWGDLTRRPLQTLGPDDCHQELTMKPNPSRPEMWPWSAWLSRQRG